MKIDKKKVTKEAFIKWLKKDGNQKRKFCVSDDASCPVAAFLLDMFPKARYASVDGHEFAVWNKKEDRERTRFVKAPSWVEGFVDSFDSHFGGTKKVSGKKILKELGL